MRVCTIIARNQWGRARVFARSIIEQHHDARVSVLVLDDDGSTGAAGFPEPFDVVGPADVGLDAHAFMEMAAVYDQEELAAALRPWLLYQLLLHDPTPVVYLDVRIEVLSPIDELNTSASKCGVVLAAFNGGTRVVDQYAPSYPWAPQPGWSDPRCVAVTADAMDLLRAWATRTADTADPSRHVTPDHFPASRRRRWEPCIMRGPVWNMSHTSGGTLTATGRGFDVDEDPVRLFDHTSDPASERPARVVAGPHRASAQLRARYAERLRWSGHLAYSRQPYLYGTTEGGIGIDRAMRRIYALEAASARRTGTKPPPNPFRHLTVQPHAASAPNFEEWLSERVCPSGVTRYLRALHEQHPTLANAFPRLDAGDGRAFVIWARSRGWREASIPPVFAGVDPEASEADMAVNVAGHLSSENGVGEGGRLLLEALREAGVTCRVASDGDDPIFAHLRLPREDFGAPEHRTNVVCVNADGITEFIQRRVTLPPDSHTIGMWAWEVDPFPQWMAHAGDGLDEVWVGSEHAAQAVRRELDVPVYVLPLPVVRPEPKQISRAQLGLPEGFLFLFCFDFGSVFERKNPLAVIEAFTTAFPTSDGACLVIKTVRGDAYPKDLATLREAAKLYPHVRIVDGYFPRDDHYAVMAACDAYVSLHRAEGYGLTIAEAMSLGKPAIATGYSGNLEFMDEANSWPIPYELVPIPPGCRPYPLGGVWAEPDVAAAAAAMREVYSDPAEARARGRRAADDMARLHAPHARVPFLRERLRDASASRHWKDDRGSSEDSIGLLAIDVAAEALTWGPKIDSPTRYGFLSRLWRRIMRRALRHFAEHQERVLALHIDALRTLEHQLSIEKGTVHLLRERIEAMERSRLSGGSGEPSAVDRGEHAVALEEPQPPSPRVAQPPQPAPGPAAQVRRTQPVEEPHR